jgi:hypothetical protein
MKDAQTSPAPFKAGDWVASLDDGRPTIGIVKGCYGMDTEFGCCIDIIVYSPEGQKIGRSSPAEGGPAAFEPACPTKHYRKIQQPKFPLRKDIYGNYAHQLAPPA